MNDWEKRNDWYQKTFVLFEIVKNLQGRETCFLPSKVNLGGERKATPIRCIKAHSLEFLKKNFKAFAFDKKPLNIYSSIAGFQDMPVFSFSPPTRMEQQKIFFNHTFSSCWVSYDFFIDIDAENLKEAYINAEKVKDLFDDLGLSYSLRFSGNRGFHFVIPDSLFYDKPLRLIDKVKLCERIANNIKGIEDIPCIDLSVYQPQRVLKVPYSLEGLNVCLPLSDEQFKNFKIEDMNVDSVLKNVSVMGRGNLQRKGLNNSSPLINMYGSEL